MGKTSLNCALGEIILPTPISFSVTYHTFHSWKSNCFKKNQATLKKKNRVEGLQGVYQSH